jgi:hypothetical protein
MTDLRQAAMLALEALREFGYHGSSPRWERVANALTAALKEQDLEPVAWIFTPNTDLLWPAEVEAKNPIELNSYQPLYTTPPAAQPEQRKPLTDEEIMRHEWIMSAEKRYEDYTMQESIVAVGAVEFARAIEAAHGIKEGT